MADDQPAEISRSLYGSPDGKWALLERLYDGLIPPPSLILSARCELIFIGTPGDVVTSVYSALVSKFAGTAGRQGGRGSGADVQQVLADMLGVSQQSVSRYVSGASEPQLGASGWSNLVRVYFGAATDA